MQFLILARVAQGVSIEQVLPHVKRRQKQSGSNTPLESCAQFITLPT